MRRLWLLVAALLLVSATPAAAHGITFTVLYLLTFEQIHLPLVAVLFGLAMLAGFSGPLKARRPRRRLLLALANLLASLSALGFLLMVLLNFQAAWSFGLSWPALGAYYALASYPTALGLTLLLYALAWRFFPRLLTEAGRLRWMAPWALGFLVGVTWGTRIGFGWFHLSWASLVFLIPAALPLVVGLQAALASWPPPRTPGFELLRQGVGEAPRCPVCSETFSGTLTQCDRCGSPHHPDCFDYNGRCGLYGCGGSARRP
jgi:MFS family permease